MARPVELLSLLEALRGAQRASDPELLLRLALRIRIQARKSMGPSNSLRRLMDSEDMAQDALGHLVAHVDRFEGETWGEFLSFARAIVEQRVAVHARHEGRAKRTACVVSANPDEQPAPSPTAEAVVADREEQKQILAAVGDLPQELRAVVEMRLRDMSYEAIAAELGSNAVAVRKRFSRALNALRAVYGI